MPKLARAAATALSLLLAQTACARSKPAATDADPALWVVKDSDTTVYLFGTVHVLKPGLSWFDEAVKAAFEKSDALVVEIIQPDAATMQRLTLAKGFGTGVPTLTARIPADKRKAVVKALGEMGVPRETYDRMDPWYAAVVLSIAPLGKMGYDPGAGAEKTLAQAAASQGKKVEALETAEQQLGFFDALPEKAQVDFLVSSVEDMPKLQSEMERMVATWSRGDAVGLAALMNENLKDSPEVAKVLLADRNARWAQWIKERMARPGTLFVAVGAGHLAGKDSVQAQLAKLNVRTKRVRY